MSAFPWVLDINYICIEVGQTLSECTEHHRQVVSICALYLGGPSFKSWREDRLSWFFSMVFLIATGMVQAKKSSTKQSRWNTWKYKFFTWHIYISGVVFNYKQNFLVWKDHVVCINTLESVNLCLTIIFIQVSRLLKITSCWYHMQAVDLSHACLWNIVLKYFMCRSKFLCLPLWNESFEPEMVWNVLWRSTISMLRLWENYR